jgi:hypothetical protein
VKTINEKFVPHALLLLLILGSPATLNAQNTIIPSPIQTYYSNFWNDDVFAVRIHSFALGSQWGTTSVDRCNTALKLNVTGGDWGWMGSGKTVEMSKLGNGYRDKNYLVWAQPLHGSGTAAIGDAFRNPWYGLRWEPAENSGLEKDWEPRDADSWPFSFGAKYHGTIPGSPSNTNYRRFVLSPVSMPSNPVRVLDSAEPRNYLRITRQVNWKDPLGTRFLIDSTIDSIVGSDTLWKFNYMQDTTDGRRLVVALNLRRTLSTDTILDDEPVLSFVVPYHLRWKDQDPTLFDSSTWNQQISLFPS